MASLHREFLPLKSPKWQLCLSYVKAHRLVAGVALAWGTALVSAALGDVPLPMPPIFSGITPPVTIDAALALLVVAVILRSLTTSMAYFEEIASPRWRIADIVIIAVLGAPSLWVTLSSVYPSMLARDVAIYLLLAISIARFSSVGTSVTVLSLWLVAQCAVYGAWDNSLGRLFTIILRDSPIIIVWPIAIMALGMWAVLGGRIKSESAVTKL